MSHIYTSTATRLALALVVVLALGWPTFAQDKDKGGATPSEATEKYLNALKSGELKTALTFVHPDYVTGTAAEFVMIQMEAMKVSEFKVGKETIEGETARVTLTWKCEFDDKMFVKRMVALSVKSAKEAGATMTDEQVAQMEKSMAEAYAQVKLLVAKENQVADLAKKNERWYLLNIRPDMGGEGSHAMGPQPGTNGQTSATAAVSVALEAAKARDTAAYIAVMAPDSYADAADLKAMFEACVIAETKIGDSTTRDQFAFVTFTAKLTFDVAKMVQAKLAAILEAYKEAGHTLSDEDLQALKQSIADSVAEQKKQFEAPNHTAIATQVDGKWYVVAMDGGDTALAALKELDAYFTALKAKDLAKVKKYREGAMDADLMFGGLCLATVADGVSISALTIKAIHADVASGSAYFAVSLKYSIKDTAALAENSLKAYLAAAKAQGTDLSDEDISTQKEHIQELIAELKEHADGEPIHVSVSKLETGWWIELSLP